MNQINLKIVVAIWNMRVNATYGEAAPQQVYQLLEEQETLVAVSVDVLWAIDGQLNDVPGSKVAFIQLQKIKT